MAKLLIPINPNYNVSEVSAKWLNDLQIYVYNQTGKVIKAIIKSSVYNKMYHKSPNLVLTDKLFVSKASQDTPHNRSEHIIIENWHIIIKMELFSLFHALYFYFLGILLL